YKCWNKLCEEKDKEFIIINEYIDNERFLDLNCEDCGKPFIRNVEISASKEILLTFRCSGKICRTNFDPFRYNLTLGKWEAPIPRFTIPEDQNLMNSSINLIKPPTKSIQEKESEIKNDLKKLYENQEKLREEQKIREKKEIIKKMFPIGNIPLLTMTPKQYARLLAYHNGKVVVFVDVPNLIRTLIKFYPNKFKEILKKSRELLIKFIQNTFSVDDDYIIRYYTKPAADLYEFNNLIKHYCEKFPENEFYHLLKIEKKMSYSDIDNYIIANSVEVLERCQLKGFVIVSSDKDYLPVMRIANFKNIKSWILGVNTPKIYEEYNINDIKYLGILNYFDK
ncbi:MAG: NYN domain-containing protein, partial [Promethearchaeia archaeon]